MCHIGGRDIKGVLLSGDEADRGVSILLEEKIEDGFMDGFGAHLGVEGLRNPELIEKIGECGVEEFRTAEQRSKELREVDSDNQFLKK